MKKEYIEKIYAGWIAKVAGVRLGAPIEGWTYEKIREAFGELWNYPADYETFAADDDTNGPLFFLRALEDAKKGEDFEAQDVGEALLNYAPFEHGFFWWGGYGISTEHTAYLNLRNGIKAPMSGSIAQNGYTAAEQIGGQIFIDSWGLVNPGNPDRAAKMAAKAASVTHDGNGIYGGMFIAACIAYAFEEKNIERIIEKGLTYIPADCEYTRVVKAVVDFYHQNPSDWRACFEFVKGNFGYDRYPGNCHIIPNIGAMILGLLYGEGDFSKTLCITNMCGWDTDCNVGNVATIMGIVCGLEGIDYDKWLKPIDDILICSSVLGDMNVMDVPYGALYILKLACMLNNEEIPEPYKTLIDERIDSCHFEYPGSTHHLKARRASVPGKDDGMKYYMENSTEFARTGERSLKFATVTSVRPAESVLVFRKTFYYAKDFSDSRYDPEFSATVYPGMTVHASVLVPAYAYQDNAFKGLQARLYVHDSYSGKLIESDPVDLEKETWHDLSFRIPALEGAMIDEMGVAFNIAAVSGDHFGSLVAFIDDLYADGRPEYTLKAANLKEDIWGFRRSIYEFSKLKGLMYLADGDLHLSCADFAETYTGRLDWTDYTATYTITPLTGANHYVLARVQGAIRSYAAGLMPNGKFAILKNENGYKVLAETDLDWQQGRTYQITIGVEGDTITASCEGASLTVKDTADPYLHGEIGIAIANGSHTALREICVK